MNWIAKIPDLALYPIDWFLRTTEWIGKNPTKSLLLGIAGIGLAWWL
jgi:hypothetical protein